jgi:hypothetical protein
MLGKSQEIEGIARQVFRKWEVLANFGFRTEVYGKPKARTKVYALQLI